MVFRRRFASIKSNKHEITWSNIAQNAGAAQAITLIKGVKSADADTATEVEIGHKVRALYMEFHFSAETLTNTKVIHWQIEVIPTGMTTSTPSAYYGDDRSYIIKRGMEMLPKDAGTVFKRIVLVLIPPKYQRIANNQFVQFRYIASSSETINACGITIYKEIY